MTGSIAGLLLAVAASMPQDPERDLAAELVDRGWVDLAEDLCRKDRSTLREDPYTLALIASARAREESDVARALVELNAAIDRFGTIKRPLLNLEHSVLGRLHVQKAQLLSDPAAWQEAEAYYRSIVAAFAKRPSSLDVDDLLLEFRLELPRVLAARAKATVADAPRRALLEEAIRLLQDYQLDTGDRPVVYEALLEEGRVRVDLKDYPRAERCFRAVLDLKKKGKALTGYPASLWNAAFLNLVRAVTLSGKPKEAVVLCERFLRENPTQARSGLGNSVLLSQAEALHAGAEDVAAIALAQKIVGQDPDGPAGRMARERIREWMKGAHATPDRMLLVADGLIEQGRYREALVDLRRCVEVCSGESERSKYEPLSAFKRGECFRALKQEAEAAVAFQDVFRKYPKHDLARRAAFEAVRSLSRVALATRDVRDRDRQEQLLKEVERLGLQGSFASYFKFLEAEILERKGQWRAAADLYRQVEETSEVYDDALVSAGHGYRLDAEAQGPKGGDAAARQLQTAEELLRRALGRLERTEGARLLPTAEFELAAVCLNEAVKKPREALTFLDRCAARLAPEQELQARLGEMALRAHLVLEELPAAVERLEKLLKAFPDHPSTARSARRVALRQESTDPAAAIRTYRVWLDRTEAVGSTTAELQSVAEGLYRTARTLNRFDDGIVSVVDLRGKPVPEAGSWKEAARAQTRLLAAKDLPAKDRTGVQSRLAWSLGLSAVSAEDWDRVKRLCEDVIVKHNLVVAGGDLDPEVLRSQRWLAGIYVEYGHALIHLGRAGQKYQFGNALRVFNNLVPIAQAGTEPWWIAQAMALQARVDRGEGDDLRVAGAALSLLEGNYPGFDGGKYGIRDLLLRMKEDLKSIRGSQR